MKVGTFSAGSNITGNIFDADRIAILCHKYSTLACFDYAAVAPYVDINVNGPTQSHFTK
jgi:selenocysteine lyase/cysteine desulfurase